MAANTTLTAGTTRAIPKDELATFYYERVAPYAECKGVNANLFVLERCSPQETAAAKAVCRTCPAKHDCLEFALSSDPLWTLGVWGGTSERERRRIRRERRGQQAIDTTRIVDAIRRGFHTSAEIGVDLNEPSILVSSGLRVLTNEGTVYQAGKITLRDDGRKNTVTIWKLVETDQP